MGVLDRVRGRDTSQLNAASLRPDPAPADAPADEKTPGQAAEYDSGDSDTLSLEARNEKEIEKHPDQVTATAEIGVQKAEAAALVWPKGAVYAVYAW